MNLKAITEKAISKDSTDNEIVVTVKRSSVKHDPDAIERALLNDEIAWDPRVIPLDPLKTGLTILYRYGFGGSLVPVRRVRR